ncbi:MAG: tetratricopeptide repeat protein [Gammaproteobacteria bacterium]
MRRTARRALGFSGAVVIAAGLIGGAGLYLAASKHKVQPVRVTADSAASLPSAATLPMPEPGFVGRAACAGCHAEQDRLWQGSHHDLAMQEATEGTVLGDFQNVEFRKDGIVSLFFRKDGRHWVRTDGPDGKLSDFEIKYTFGFYPLQQYLVELPGGRFQALSIAWDSRPKDQGGERWFHLYPDEKIDHSDELHWSKHSQNWNFMCAECHSTNLQKNYDPQTRTYRTAWSEIDVACEACHGPASQHLIWAEQRPGFETIDAKTKGLIVQLDERREIRWMIDPSSGNARRSAPRLADKEVQICGRCHARRASLFGDYRYGPLMDTHLPSLLQETLYHADGQIKGEVYEYGSFLQSKMYRSGVTCSDCHEPHSLKLRAKGGEVCLKCHTAGKYDTEKHHFHGTDTAGADCINCHMPGKTYMTVDPRRDHSFRIPRPDLTERIGIPNACNNCHANRPASWSADKVHQWYGHDPRGYQDFADTLHAIRSGGTDAVVRLTALLKDKHQPAIARATAAAEMGIWMNRELLPGLKNVLSDLDSLVRSAGLQALEQLPPEQRWSIAHEMLRDPVRSLRALAAAALAGTPAERMSSDEQADFRRASEDYFSSLQFNADDPGAQVNLGNFHAALGETAEAERAYGEALNLDPNWVPAYLNLTDLLRQSNRDSEGELLLRQGLDRRPKAAALFHSLGLLLVRKKNLEAALDSLKQAVDLAPEEARFVYVYGVALYSAGRIKEARSAVEKGLERAPGDPSLNELKSQLAMEPNTQ